MAEESGTHEILRDSSPSEQNTKSESGCIEIQVNELVFQREGNDRRPFVKVRIDGVEIEALLDSGANCTVIGIELANLIDIESAAKIPGPNQVVTADSTKHRFENMYQLPYQFMGREETINTIVLPQLGVDAMLGMDFWERFNIGHGRGSYASDSFRNPGENTVIGTLHRHRRSQTNTKKGLYYLSVCGNQSQSRNRPNAGTRHH